MEQTYDDIYQEFFNHLPPRSIAVRDSDSDILRAGRGFIEGFDFTMQTQVGCPGGCLFCYVPSGRMLTPESMRGKQGEKWGFEVRPKRHVLEKLAIRLGRGELADKTVYWSGVTDPYATKAAETRAIWELLCRAPAHLHPRRIAVQTRYRPDRDADIMADYVQSTHASDDGPPVVVSYSIGTDWEDLIRAWERATPSFEQRMNAIGTLRRAGIRVVPTLSPFGLWDDLAGTLKQFRAWEIAYITCLFFKKGTDSANTPGRFLGYLQRHYPMLLDRQWQAERLSEMQAVFGAENVLMGKAGFTSLTAPQRVGEIPADEAL